MSPVPVPAGEGEESRGAGRALWGQEAPAGGGQEGRQEGGQGAGGAGRGRVQEKRGSFRIRIWGRMREEEGGRDVCQVRTVGRRLDQEDSLREERRGEGRGLPLCPSPREAIRKTKRISYGILP